MPLARIQEPPEKGLILLTGAPGAGKSTFCHHVVLNSIALEKPVIFLTTECTPNDVRGLLREKGLGDSASGSLSFVDAFTETVGLKCDQQTGTVCANCNDLNSLSIGVTRLQERLGTKGILLAIDSLTSPYLFNGPEIIRFIKVFLSRFTAEGNAVIILIDEGCGREEDLIAMMSISDGVIKIACENNQQTVNVVKFPGVSPTSINVHMETRPTIRSTFRFEPAAMKQFMQGMFGGDEKALRKEMGDYVNMFWPNLAHWSSMLWDPQGFPTAMYELNKEETALVRDTVSYVPWKYRLFFQLIFLLQNLRIIPKNYGSVKNMKTAIRYGGAWVLPAQLERSGIIEYMDDISRANEHYFRVYECSDCWGLENVGCALASHLPPAMAGQLLGISDGEQNWNAIETKCVGLGDPYCEFKMVPEELGIELRSSLQKDVSIVSRINDRLIDQMMEFILNGQPFVERTRLGNEVHLHVVMHAMGLPHIGEKYQIAQRMGGAITGKKVGERLMKAGLSENEALGRIMDFMKYCKVGQPSFDDTVTIRENCESIRTRLFTEIREPSCYFTTGFLNGLYSAVKNRHVREVRCITAGDPLCEWEII